MKQAFDRDPGFLSCQYIATRTGRQTQRFVNQVVTSQLSFRRSQLGIRSVQSIHAARAVFAVRGHDGVRGVIAHDLNHGRLQIAQRNTSLQHAHARVKGEMTVVALHGLDLPLHARWRASALDVCQERMGLEGVGARVKRGGRRLQHVRWRALQKRALLCKQFLFVLPLATIFGAVPPDVAHGVHCSGRVCVSGCGARLYKAVLAQASDQQGST